VKIQGIILETFEAKRAFRQGDSLSHYLLTWLKRVIRDAELDIRGNIYKDSINCGLC
jgi:hypothetical protein